MFSNKMSVKITINVDDQEEHSMSDVGGQTGAEQTENLHQPEQKVHAASSEELPSEESSNKVQPELNPDASQSSNRAIRCIINHNGINYYDQLLGVPYQQAPRVAEGLATWSTGSSQTRTPPSIRTGYIAASQRLCMAPSAQARDIQPFQSSRDPCSSMTCGQCYSRPLAILPPVESEQQQQQQQQSESNNNSESLRDGICSSLALTNIEQNPSCQQASDDFSSIQRDVPLQQQPVASTSASQFLTIDPQVSRAREEYREVELFGQHLLAFVISGQEWVCAEQIARTVLVEFDVSRVRGRKAALKIPSILCTSFQSKVLYAIGAVSTFNTRYSLIGRGDAERLCRSLIIEAGPKFPEDLRLPVVHKIYYGCRGSCIPLYYRSKRSQCISCTQCGLLFSPNKFVHHSHINNVVSDLEPLRTTRARNWRTALELDESLPEKPTEEMRRAWVEFKSMFESVNQDEEEIVVDK